MRVLDLGWCTRWLALASLCLASCGGGERAIHVFAASSLAPAFEQLAKEFERTHPGQRIALHCAGSPTLALQIQEGAPADVFASADEANLRKVIEARLALTEPEVFAKNRLALAVPRGNPRAIRGLEDLARADLRIGLCGPEVPAGRYARACLEKAGIHARSRSDEPNVSALVTKIAFGELDAGIVYATDVRRDDVTELPIPDECNVVASYPLVVVSTGADSEGGRAFARFALSDEGQAILARYGFLRP
ncbi:MAG: molybdate ABC transporter substrate-binding protein [Planctomycetes bacterium]|nr:molybdate ABC transporter substrate-binding protein [Planctomycetota bacterium]